MDRQQNALSITWKDTIETFTTKESSQVEAVYEKITAHLTKRKDETEKQTAVEEKRLELAQTTVNVMDTADSLFSILKRLHGRVDWKLVEVGYKQVEENAGKLAQQNANPLNLDLKPLSSAVEEHSAKEAGEKTFGVLKALYDGFDGLVSSTISAEETHPSPRDAKLSIQALYMVNDMLLGKVVGDEETAKEGAELLKVLKELAKNAESKIDVSAVKDSLGETYDSKENLEQFAEDLRSKLDQQFKEPPAAEAETEQPKEPQP